MTTTITRLVLIFLSTFFCCYRLQAASIVLHTHNAVAWLPQQTIQGTLTGFTTKKVIIHHDNQVFSVVINKQNAFSFSLILHDGANHIWVQANNKGHVVLSDTVLYRLGYYPEPVIKPYATINNNAIILHAATVSNPWKKLTYYWTGDKRNPASVTISHADDSLARVHIPDTTGVYYFNLAVTSGTDTAKFQTYVIKKEKELQAFNMDSMYATWIDDAVIYEITPYAFVKNTSYDDITNKLPEIKQLGVTTIWLQPVFKTQDGGQGYDIIDYFSLRNDLGSEAQLQQLIQTAKTLGLKILFDFVPNHTSIHHPYAEDCATYQTASHYYNFYQHTDDGVMYSSQYHTDKNGFIYYFWEDLVNLNFANAEVQQWMIEACKYWVKKLNIDGYRFDAVWGVNARQPDFGKRLQLELKAVKPDLLFLAEDKGSVTSTYAKGFDAAYDWTADTGWVSQWSWQYQYNQENNLLIFNFPVAAQRVRMLRKSLFHNGDSIHSRLHFIENNDLPRLTASLGVARTKMAAALTFALPGIPLIYNGQEIGLTKFPSKKNPTFKAGQTIQSLDKDSMFSFHQQLAAIRSAHSSLRNNFIKEIKLSTDAAILAFHRGNEQEDIVTVINMDTSASTALLDLQSIIKKEVNTFTLTDLITGEVFSYKNMDVTKVAVSIKGYSTRMLILIQDDVLRFKP